MPGGNVYEGMWKDERMHGEGKIIFTNGSAFEWIGKNLKDQKERTVIRADESILGVNWEDGELKIN